MNVKVHRDRVWEELGLFVSQRYLGSYQMRMGYGEPILSGLTEIMI